MSQFPILTLLLLLAVAAACAEDAGELREKGVQALKDSQSDPRLIVDAARFFAKASALYSAAGDEEKSVEMNSFLYWCKKKMTLQDIEAFTKGGETVVSETLKALEKKIPKTDEAETWLARAERFAAANPSEHLLIAIRFFEVADRFQGSKQSFTAQDRSLKEQVLAQEKTSGVKSAALQPNETQIRSAVPPADKRKEAERLLKDLFKEDYAKTDAQSRLALCSKILKQADESKDDPAAQYVLLREAREIAILAGDTERASKAQSRAQAAFTLNGADTLAELNRLEPLAHTPETAAALATVLLLAANDALKTESYEFALRFASKSEDVGRYVKNNSLQSRIKSENSRMLVLKRESALAAAAQTTLTAKPDDPAANFVVGKFALMRGDAPKAFELLSKGSDTVLAGLAKRELTPPENAAEKMQLAESWASRAEKEPPQLKEKMHERAMAWYSGALPGLGGLAKVKAVTALKALIQEVTGLLPSYPKITDPKWISNGATYVMSSFDPKFPPSPKLMDGSGKAYYSDAPDTFSIHSGKGDKEPHFVVDLGQTHIISGFEILNRKNSESRARTLTIWIGAAQEGPWTEIWRATDTPLKWSFELPKYARGRYVKIGLREEQIFHLNRLKILGE